MTKEQFGEAVTAQLNALHSVSYSLLQNPYDQQDAVQEAVKKALLSREKLRNEAYFKTWLIRILINECHAIHRQKKRVTPMETLPKVAPPEADSALFEAMQALPEKLRLPLTLHHIAGYDTLEVSKILGITRSTVKYRLVRGREHLKQLLTEQEVRG